MVDVAIVLVVVCWLASIIALARFHGFIMKNTSTAGRGPTMEELVDAVHKAQARVDGVFASPVRSMSAYTVLGVSSTATPDEIKSAYRRLRSLNHPDHGGDADKFQKIQAAYEQLMKPTRCPECEGKGTIRVKRGAFVDTAKCPRCWPEKGSEK